MESSLKISFPDQSASFCYGVEFGRLLERIESGNASISNNGFPIRVENKELVETTCKSYGYIPIFGTIHFGEWIDFMGIKNQSSDN